MLVSDKPGVHFLYNIKMIYEPQALLTLDSLLSWFFDVVILIISNQSDYQQDTSGPPPALDIQDYEFSMYLLLQTLLPPHSLLL